jgi:small subunit ribosomal protein S7
MPRRRRVIRRVLTPDSRYNSKLVTKFINAIMMKGKKSISESVLYGALDLVGSKMNEEPIRVFEKAIENVKPVVEVKSRRVGGSTYQVPVEIRGDRRTTLAMRWIILNARARNEKSMKEKLAAEFMDAVNGRGASVKKKEDTHRMAEANRAFAHYRW